MQRDRNDVIQDLRHLLVTMRVRRFGYVVDAQDEQIIGEALELLTIAPEAGESFDSRWRDIKVVLPPEGEDVLGHYDNGEFAIIRRKWSGGYVLRNGTSDIPVPGHVSLMFWSPLLRPPVSSPQPDEAPK